MISGMGHPLGHADESVSASGRGCAELASLPSFQEFPVLDGAGFRDLLVEWNGLSSAGSRLRPHVDPLLAVAAAVHGEQPFPAATWVDWSAADLMALYKRITEGVFEALAFIPPQHFDQLRMSQRSDFGSLATKCEALFACHVARSGTPRAAEYIESYALLIELWRSARATELRRLEEAQIGVTIAVLLRGGDESQRALEILTMPAASSDIPALRRGVSAALKTLERAHVAPVARWTPTKDGRREPASREEARGDLGKAIAERLADFRSLSVRDRHALVMGRGLERLADDLNQAAQGALRKAKTKKRRPMVDRPQVSGCPFCGTEIHRPCTCSGCGVWIPRESQGTPFTRVPENLAALEPSGSAAAEIHKLIERRLGQKQARWVSEVANGATTRDVAATHHVSEKTVQRVFHKLRTDQGLRADILAIFRQ